MGSEERDEEEGGDCCGKFRCDKDDRGLIVGEQFEFSAVPVPVPVPAIDTD